MELHSWDEYAEWHLGLTDGASDETKARYAFVFGALRSSTWCLAACGAIDQDNKALETTKQFRKVNGFLHRPPGDEPPTPR